MSSAWPARAWTSPSARTATARTPRFADVTLGVEAGPEPQTSPSPNRFAALMAMPPAERMAFWTEEFNRCVKCYAVPAGLPNVLLRAVHCGQEPAHCD